MHEILPETLKEYMRLNLISQSKLARRANIYGSDLSQTLNGRKPFWPAWRKKVAEALNKKESELFPEYEEKGD